MYEYIQALRLYAVFDGRATSREYWRFILISSSIWMALCGVDLLTGFTFPDMGFSLASILFNLSGLGDPGGLLSVLQEAGGPMTPFDVSGGSGLFGTLYDWGTTVPVYAITVRRLHDSGRRGWWALLNAIPLLGPLLLIKFMLAPSDAGENEYTLEPSNHEPLLARRLPPRS
jgi:uncharacterized membrane protein YhaH (DUF805 family)